MNDEINKIHLQRLLTPPPWEQGNDTRAYMRLMFGDTEQQLPLYQIKHESGDVYFSVDIKDIVKHLNHGSCIKFNAEENK